MTLKKVISGGQVGADIAGVRAARNHGLETGGWMTQGFKTVRGALEEETIKLYGFQETVSPVYPIRTEYNVRDSDGTLRLAYNFNGYGELSTLKSIKKHNKPYFDIYLHQDYRVYNGIPSDYLKQQVVGASIWLELEKIKVLNVAGNADKRIEGLVYDILTNMFSLLDKQ